MTNKTIKIVHKLPGMKHKPEAKTVTHDLDTLQSLVSPRGEADSLIERCYAPAFEEQGIEVYANEMGLYDPDCTHNVQIGGIMLQGPVFFVSANHETGEFVSLTEAQVEFVIAKLGQCIQAIF